MFSYTLAFYVKILQRNIIQADNTKMKTAYTICENLFLVCGARLLFTIWELYINIVLFTDCNGQIVFSYSYQMSNALQTESWF